MVGIFPFQCGFLPGSIINLRTRKTYQTQERTECSRSKSSKLLSAVLEGLSWAAPPRKFARFPPFRSRLRSPTCPGCTVSQSPTKADGHRSCTLEALHPSPKLQPLHHFCKTSTLRGFLELGALSSSWRFISEVPGRPAFGKGSVAVLLRALAEVDFT